MEGNTHCYLYFRALSNKHIVNSVQLGKINFSYTCKCLLQISLGKVPETT